MVAMFLGHGSPMNAIEENDFTKVWKMLGQKYHPKGILMISAHWVTNGTKIQSAMHPKKIDDMYGFPKELYDLKYPVTGDSYLTKRVIELIGAEIDDSWGIDHGAWSILAHMYPNADIPLVQMSLDKNLSPSDMFEIGKKLGQLREEGYMIIGSGNVVHSFKHIKDDPVSFALDFDNEIENMIKSHNYEGIINYHLIDNQKKAFQTSEHFDPLLYVIGASVSNKIDIYNKKVVYEAFSMTSYVFS
ncbi:dioxygenase [Acidaminobacter sp. JC074]|uniref:DODA-type extradiol aromatic ring-opening family dioxygenase n=1 Tax=Acidaminobacter sp. JC074 TaxID=2530199 RepID=UPI001F0FEB77|nr:dioxygenase [Acidaminobacter sp. JC074]MCH4887171.1 dioxygenase [Acidaminobacter sp. JC074]